MRIGPEKTYEQRDYLHDHVQCCGDGIFDLPHVLDDSDVPEGLLDFIISQYNRFGITLPPKGVITAGVNGILHIVSSLEPYILFTEGSDVRVDQNWAKYAYEIDDPYLKKVIEVTDPSEVESFSYAPEVALEAYTYHMQNVGMENMHYYLVTLFEEYIGGGLGEGIWQFFDEEEELALRSLASRPDGELDEERFEGYFKLVGWATWCWLLSPDSAEWKAKHNDIFYECYKKGECIIHEGIVIGPDEYKKLDRPTQSCAVCGLDAWCVELVQVSGTPRFICEHHLNGDLPKYGDNNCGSRTCRYFHCKYHPYSGKTDGLYQTMRESGQLTGMVQKRQELQGPDVKRLLG